MRHNWEYRKIGEICNIKTGKLDANASSENGEYPFFTCSKETLRIDNYSYDEECVLIAGNGDLNVKYYKGKFDAYQRTYIVTLKDKNEELSVPYLYQFFSKYIEHLRKVSIGGIIKYIKLNNLTDAEIPVPPLPTQRAIVAELDTLNEILDKKRQQLKELDTLAQSIFYDMFGDPVENEKGWEVKKMGEVCDSVSYGTSSPACENGKYKYLRMNNLTYSGYIDLSNVKTINLPDESYEKYVVRKDDILFNRTNSRELVGKTALFNLDEEMIIAGYIIRVRVHQHEVLPVFIVKYMNTPFIKDYLYNLCKGAVNQANINSKELQNIPLYVPPLSLQQSFAQKIEAIEKQNGLINASIKEVETLLNATMDKYFG